jgi:hypothetical protein
MNHAPIRVRPHSVFILDLEPQLGELQNVLVDYCDDFSLVGEINILLTTINLLGTSYAVEEAVEAMEIHVNAFCNYEHTPYKTDRLRHSIWVFMREMHRIFNECQMYGPDDRMAYVFAGWHGPFTPIFAPRSHVEFWPQARSGTVHSEPYGTNALDIFQLINDPDAYHRLYNFSLRDKADFELMQREILPF